MKPVTDRDGKSKTASAVDAEHYPEQNEVDSHESPGDKIADAETNKNKPGKNESGSVQK
jgi:hypothetical protein